MSGGMGVTYPWRKHRSEPPADVFDNDPVEGVDNGRDEFSNTAEMQDKGETEEVSE